MPHVAIVHHRQAAYGHAEAATVDLSAEAAALADTLMKQGFIPHVWLLTPKQSREYLPQPEPVEGVVVFSVKPNEEPNMVLISLEHARGRFSFTIARNVPLPHLQPVTTNPDGVPAKLQSFLLSLKPEDLRAWLEAKQ